MRNISNRDLGGGRDGTGIVEKLEAGPQRGCIVLSLGMGRSLEAVCNFGEESGTISWFVSFAIV